MKRTKLFLFSALCAWVNFGFAQLNTEGAFGGTGQDSIVSVNPTIDGTGYVVLGSSNSFSSSTEAFLMRTDQAGNYSWARTVSSTNTNFEPVAAVEAIGSTPTNQEYIICFHTNSSSTLQMVRYNYNTDTYVAKKFYDIQINEMANMGMIRTANGYILVVKQKGGVRSTIISFDSNMNYLAHLSEQHGSAIITDLIVSEGRIFIAGTATDNQYFYLKEVNQNLASTGIGQKAYGVAFDQGGTARVDNVQIARNAAGEFVIATNSSTAPMNGKVLLKTDANGNNAVAYEYGLEGQSDFYITDVTATTNGFVCTGYTSATYVNSQGKEDVMFVEISSAMKLLKASIFGKSKIDKGLYVYANNDASVTIFAKSNSFSQTGDNDFYIIKTTTASTALCNETIVNFTLEQETVNTPGGVTLYDWTYTINNGTDPNLTYVTSDATLTALCGCEQALSFEASAEACTGEPVMLSLPNGNLDYVWDFGGTIVDSTVVDGTLYITYTTPGIKQIRLSVANNSCFKPGTAAIAVYPTPEITILAPATACAGAAIEMNCTVTPKADSLWKYNWDFGKNATPSMATAINPRSITYTEGNRTDTISLTVSDAHCSNVKRQTITINPTPIADFSANGPKCTGENVSFVYTGTEVATASLSWNFNGGVNSATNAAPVVSYANNQSGEKLISLTASIGSCSTQAQKTVTINQSPDATFALAQASICAKNTLSFTAPNQPTGTDWTYTWDFGTGAVPTYSIAQNPADVLFNEDGAKTISLKIESAYCSDQKTRTLTVNPTPNVSFETSAPACTGDTVRFIFTGDAKSGNFTWNFDGEQQRINTSNTTPSVLYARADKGEKIIRLTVNAAGCTDSASKAITVHETPAVSFMPLFDTLCLGTINRFANTGSSGSTWKFDWDLGAKAFPATSKAENPKDVTYQTAGAKAITLIISSDYCSNSFTDSIYVNALPIVTIIEDTTICASETVTLGGQSVATYSYKWFPSATLNNSTIANPTSDPDAAITVYTLTVVDQATLCVNTDSVTVTKLEPVTANAGVDVEICRGESIEIGSNTAENNADYIFTWHDLKADTLKTYKGISSLLVSPDSTTTYQLMVMKTVTKICGIGSDEVTVTVHQLPNVQATDYKHRDTTEIAVGENVQLIATGATQYEWTPVMSLNNEGIFNPIASPIETTLYFAKGTDMFGCSNTDSVLVIVNIPQYWVPTAFSPDGDGINDLFKVETKGTTAFELSIFSRTGEPVFYTNNQHEAWNGNKNGTSFEMPQGAYVFVVKGTYSNGETFSEKGIINLVR